MVKLSREFNSLLSDGRYLKMGFFFLFSLGEIDLCMYISEKDKCKNGSRIGGHLRDKWQFIWGTFISDLVDSTKDLPILWSPAKALCFSVTSITL